MKCEGAHGGRGSVQRSDKPPADIWLIDPGAAVEQMGCLLACLDPEERRRAARARAEADRDLFVASHAGVRHVLARYLGIAPRAVSFARDGPAGARPRLAAASAIQFNMSHTKGLAVVAVRRGGGVGIDVEWTGRRMDVLKLARRCLSVADAQELAGLDPDLALQQFLERWTRLEAAAKLTGEGLATALGRARRGANPGAGVRTYDLVLTAEHIGAVALSDSSHD